MKMMREGRRKGEERVDRGKIVKAREKAVVKQTSTTTNLLS